MRYDLRLMRAWWTVVLLSAGLLRAGNLSPKDHFGFEPGTDYKLADYQQIVSYFQKLDGQTDRLQLVEFGRSSEGRPLYLAIISSESNLRRLAYYREISRKLALGEVSPEEARKLVEAGRVIVWIDSGLHATEVAPAQHAPVLAHLLVTEETEEIRRIRDNVILLQVPVINPDGLELVVNWYRANLGTRHELAPLPRLYQKYAGHDNNRDWFMFNLVETRHVARLLFHEWLPQIVYNQHQAPPLPARIFVPPYADPVNPNIPRSVLEGVALIGAAMRERFAREGKTGVLSYAAFDAWWNGGLRTAPLFHNMHGVLTETAAGFYATPRLEDPGSLPTRFAGGLPSKLPTIFYEPWTGGRWGLKEAIEYMLTADLALLSLAAERRSDFLWKAYQLARDAIEAGQRGSPHAYIVPQVQHDPTSTVEMLWRLAIGGIRIEKAQEPFEAEGKQFAAGDYVLRAAQPFRAYLIDLFERQEYPELGGRGNAPARPYDVAGWTLWMNMGVQVVRVDRPFHANLKPVVEFKRPEPSRDLRDLGAYRLLSCWLQAGRRVRLFQGRLVREGEEGFLEGDFEFRLPRVGVYVSWVPNTDAGWTQWLLDEFLVPYRVLHSDAFRHGDFHNLDVIVLPSQEPESILHGYRAGEATVQATPDLEAKSEQRPEYCGGLGLTGLVELERFVRRGGVLVAFDEATRVPVELFPLPVRDVTRVADERSRFQCPGSLVRIRVQTQDPLALGMPEMAYAFVRGGKAWQVRLIDRQGPGEQAVRVVARYADKDLLASGWVAGAETVQGKAALVVVPYGKGSVVLFGFRPQFRGQTFGTFKFLLNAIYLASARKLR